MRQSSIDDLNEVLSGDRGKIDGMNLDPCALLGEEVASRCVVRTDMRGTAQECAASTLGMWIDELARASFGFGANCLTDRMAIMGLEPTGSRISFGGATRIVRCLDGWVALPLARESDIEMLPAMFEREFPESEVSDVATLWMVVESLIAMYSSSHLRERATLLGMPLAVMGEINAPTAASPALQISWFGSVVKKQPEELRVLELAPMWAGPLAGKILGSAGARVTKVESPTRPDGTREGSPAFFAYLNGNKSVAPVDFASDDAGDTLRQLISESDVVIEGSRPRALEQLGIDARQMVADGEVDIWLSVTGYGRDSQRVAFGDDAAVAGGLCDIKKPAFTGDASGDPLTGLAGAVGVLAAMQSERACLIDLSMARVCAWAADR